MVENISTPSSVSASRERAPLMVRLFCLVASMERRPDFRSPSTHACRDRHRDCGVANMETLKRRKRGIVRQVPLPQYVLSDLDRDFGLRRLQ